MSWYRVDVSRVSPGVWRTYIRELSLHAAGTTKATAQENTVTLIEETTGDKDPQVVWLEC